jgi:hypothetical protein
MILTSAASAWRSVERFSIVTTLGIRFWDPAFDVQVDDGLAVTAYPFGARRPATMAFSTPSGVYAFQGLPGLHDIEYPGGDPESPGSLPAGNRFLIEVADGAARFLPVAFFVDAPFNGIFPTDSPQAPDAVAPPGFYLFSAPTRAATPLVALVRAQLTERLDATNEQPASYAVMEIDVPTGDTWVGLADDRGAAALLFPYPTFTGMSNASSSTLPSAAMAQQNWPITVRVRYQPSALSFPPGFSLPELRTVLAQAPAAIWTQRASPPGEALSSLSATLVFGQELTMRSAGESVLLVSLGSLP